MCDADWVRIPQEMAQRCVPWDSGFVPVDTVRRVPTTRAPVECVHDASSGRQSEATGRENEPFHGGMAHVHGAHDGPVVVS